MSSGYGDPAGYQIAADDSLVVTHGPTPCFQSIYTHTSVSSSGGGGWSWGANCNGWLSVLGVYLHPDGTMQVSWKLDGGVANYGAGPTKQSGLASYDPAGALTSFDPNGTPTPGWLTNPTTGPFGETFTATLSLKNFNDYTVTVAKLAP